MRLKYTFSPFFHLIKQVLFPILLGLSTQVLADTSPFQLTISSGNNVDVSKALVLSDVGEGKNKIHFIFKDKAGDAYTFDLKYKKLPSNRSYPTSLYLTIKDGKGNKLGFLFFANNGVSSLKKLGIFGLTFNVKGQSMDVKFDFGQASSGNLYLKNLSEERFVQDTLVPNFHFQMIRPVILPMDKQGIRSQTYALDYHPYAVNYTMKQIRKGVVEFQYNLYGTAKGNNELLERIYFEANSLSVLREAMYAGKYFDPKNGVFKLVFYPAMGQTTPPK